MDRKGGQDILAGFPAHPGEAVPQAVSGWRSFSLFEPIPSDRNCFRSNIPLIYCVCQREAQVDLVRSLSSSLELPLL